MRAWVDGWNAGRDRAQTDDAKRSCADKLASEFAAEDCARELLLACKCALADLEGLTGDYMDYDSDEPVAETVRELRAAIAVEGKRIDLLFKDKQGPRREAMLTEKQRLDYVMSKWSHCPKCGSEQIQGDSIEIDGNIAWQRVGCLDCDAEWIDTYTLSDVQTLNRKWDGGMEPEMASASELRRSLSCLLEVFDQLYAEGEDWEDDERVQQARRILAKGFSSETDDQITGTEEPKPGRPGGEWMEVFLGLLSIVEDEYELDPEPDDIQSWKDLIDRANRLLRFKPEQTEKGRDDGEAEQQRD